MWNVWSRIKSLRSRQEEERLQLCQKEGGYGVQIFIVLSDCWGNQLHPAQWQLVSQLTLWAASTDVADLQICELY